MTLYQQVPVTLDPFTVIPTDAPPSVGLSEQGAAEVQAASETFASETAVSFTLAKKTAPRELEITLEPATPFQEGFEVQWDFGDGATAVSQELTQSHIWPAEGHYTVTAVVTQPGETSFALTGTAHPTE